MDTQLISYEDLLKELEKAHPCHLLLGNGFNNSLGIKTTYEDIFTKMKEEYSGYKGIEKHIAANSYNIEKLIGDLKQQIQETGEGGVFLKEYVERKVKIDFMKATSELVKKSVKNVYQEHNEDIHLLFKNFSSYFTLNYDPFLYLLLLKFKKNHDNYGKILTFTNKKRFQQDHLDQTQNQIHSEILQLRKEGKLFIAFGDNNSEIDLCRTKKGQFENVVRQYNERENKRWRNADIKKVCDQIWKNDEGWAELSVQDSFRGGFFREEYPQNLYFLHGAFHIRQSQHSIQKIEATQNKVFIERLEDAINQEHNGIVCVLANASGDKEGEILKNRYLTKCFESLEKISGTMVILGSSLAENDKHVFDQISKSALSHIFVSCCEKNKKRTDQRSRKLFAGKKVTLFDHETISYGKHRKSS